MNNKIDKIVLTELEKFMTWWEAHYEIKTANDVRCDEIRPLYVAWKNKQQEDGKLKPTSDEAATPIREEEDDTKDGIQEREEV